ncbi:EXS-domain-containing protein [Corynespora cassiicola Philippines]|uniref:EXS-domain-containing protein n=1 Tax=Corynespora cassiicola Philippines TaxID=1448308 RepID=A0A2T2P9K4_CORCC|nr:EXS-domain-containing protein [Corynespora cassiicola Philippines]
MGDMFCSLTYSMGNIALFFCLYSRGWDEPAQCNSSHSRLLGFFSTLPGIWRALQCIKRYYDTRNVFPHLVNCGKYTATIVYYVTLSVYRIDKTTTNRALFITFAIFNSIYCSIWDIMMDWSLGEWDAEHRGLRKTLGYKKVWWYYSAMILDPILRFNWIFYAIIPLQLQHSAITSFAVALSEVFRRGVWTLFRVENEHCTNVARYRASRDVELPYDIPSSPEVDAQTEERGRREDEEQPPSLLPPNLRRTSTMPADTIHTGTEAATGTGADLQETSTRSSTRRRRAHSQSEEPSPLARGLTRVGTLMRDAHAQDFERRRRPELGATSTTAGRVIDDESDDDDDDWKAGSGSGSGSGSRSDPAEWDRRDEAEIQQVREEVAIGRGGASNGNATPVGIGGRA